MDASRVDAILAKIDEAVGPPSDETDAQHKARQLMVEKDHAARVIRKAGSPST